MSETPLFDTYVVVDWSAASSPKTGADSIWIATAERAGAGLAEPAVVNVPTRGAASALLAERLSDVVARGGRALVGFDFAFGYPRGFAGRVRPDEPTWRGVWKTLAARIRDDDDNANNRFEVAAALNAAVSGTDFPFWGCPPAAASDTLRPTRPAGFGPDTLAERRAADARAAGPQPVWKLAYPGSVGGQTLLGIAHLYALRHHPWLADAARVWPFETGLRAPAPADGGQVVLAEVYPSMIAARPANGEVKDAAQIRALARHLAGLDGSGALAGLFAGPDDLGPEARTAIEREEGWILGIETAGKPAHGGLAAAEYLRDPDAIYRRSFETIRAETDLTSFPEDLRPVVERLVHACGMTDIAGDLAFTPGAAAAGTKALAAGAPVLVDAEMVAAGIIRDRLPAANAVVCTLAEPGVADAARAAETTRSAAAVERWRPRLDGAVVAIGNAPTALFRLLEIVAEGAPRPAVVLGFPVGFVGAAEAKDALIDADLGLDYVTLRGRRGGSALAAAAVNALAGAAR